MEDSQSPLVKLAWKCRETLLAVYGGQKPEIIDAKSLKNELDNYAKEAFRQYTNSDYIPNIGDASAAQTIVDEHIDAYNLWVANGSHWPLDN